MPDINTTFSTAAGHVGPTAVCTSLPHKFPPLYVRSKHVRRIHLGRLRANSPVLRATYYLFILNPEFGVCKLACITPKQLHRNPRTGKTHFDFRADEDGHNVLAYTSASTTAAESESMFEAMHQMLKQPLDQQDAYQSVAGPTLGMLTGSPTD